MGVTLQLILGIFLALTTSGSFAYDLRQIREAPLPTPLPSSIQNITEINNRDLNKIVKVNPKTEALVPKLKSINNNNNFDDFPIKLGKSEEELHYNKQNNETQKEEVSKEDGKHRREEEVSRAIQLDSSKFWSPDFHSKNYVFTASPTPEDGTRHPSFENSAELTTPTTKLFDQKFKETVESVEQKLDDVDLDDEDQDIEDNKENLSVEDLLSNNNHKNSSSLEFETTKTIVNNETVNKNSIHKDLNIEQTKTVNFENVYNDTNIYNQKGDTAAPTTSTTTAAAPTTSTTIAATTRKNALLKANVSEKSLQVLSNNIETDFVNSPVKIKGEPDSILRGNISDQENIIPLKLGTEKPLKFTSQAVEEVFVTTTTTTTSTEMTLPTTTEDISSSTFVNSMQSDGTTTTFIPEEDTTIFIVENATEISDETTTESSTLFEVLRTSKSLDNSIRTSESTTLSDGNNNIETTTLEDTVTTTEEEKLVTLRSVSEAATMIEVVTEAATTTTEQVPTTEFTFVHIKNTDDNHTTLLPEILSPNLNYSTSTKPQKDGEIRKVLADLEQSNFSSSSTTSITTTTTTSSVVVVNTTSPTVPEEFSVTGTESSYTKDVENSPSGSNKGVIAAIAISSVGAVCLVLLAGLLYVMKKRQRRLNYGPRCRPVSLDDYSIDNLSVYNSVRRKGGARMSKRSFGNPAFEDPVAPTHPLNFQALTKFATNLDDIKAEFEDVPQITARTSELPEGCDTKNRYANVIPLPETRVYLNPIDGYPNSDYINANYVTGPKNIKGYYIATQAPMQNTVDDFWRMIWEQQCKVILMLTHLVENGLEKCVDYLPESEVLECSRLFGDFQITLKKREVKEKYIISSIQLKNMVSNSWREVTHFWYLGWPEKGVPSEVNSLIAFLIEARSYMKTATLDKRYNNNGVQNNGTQNEHNPVVVHCSPGTGRTGVAIACDIAIREFETTRLVDIPKIVYRIRRDRANAIQTKEQYMFVYKVVSLYAAKLTGGALENV